MPDHQQKLTVLDAIQQLTQMRTELLLFAEAEKSKAHSLPLPTANANLPAHVHSLDQAEKSVRIAALLWLMDIAARVSLLADDLMEEISSIPGLRVEHESLLKLSHQGAAFTDSIEEHFLQHMDDAQRALRVLHISMPQPQLSEMDAALSAVRAFFQNYLDSPEDTIQELLGSSTNVTSKPPLN